MNPADLRALLDLKPKESKSSPIPQAQSQLNFPSSSTVFKLDKFDMLQGERLSEQEVCKQNKLTPLDLADLHGACFLPEPEQTKSCQNKRREEFLTNLVTTQEYQSLHGKTALNLPASDLAAIEFGKNYAKLQEEDQERQEKLGNKPPKNPAKEEQKSEARCMKAVAKAMAAAEKEVGDFLEYQRGIGGEGATDQVQDPSKALEQFHRVKNHPQLRRIFDNTGRFRLVAQATQRRKVIHGQDDIVGVEVGGDIARLCPHELSLLSDLDTELDTMRRIVENQAMVRKHKGVEKVGKGPIIVCVDESGSMYGEPIALAKAFALSMGWIARHQRRWIAFVSYSGGTQGVRVAFPPNKWNEQKLLDWLCHFYSGGTTCDVPLEQLPKVYWPEFIAQGMKSGKTDLIVITDGLISVPYHVEQEFNLWKKQVQCKAIGLMLNCQNGGGLNRVLDEVYPISTRNLSTDHLAIERCFSI